MAEAQAGLGFVATFSRVFIVVHRHCYKTTIVDVVKRLGAIINMWRATCVRSCKQTRRQEKKRIDTIDRLPSLFCSFRWYDSPLLQQRERKRFTIRISSDGVGPYHDFFKTVVKENSKIWCLIARVRRKLFSWSVLYVEKKFISSEHFLKSDCVENSLFTRWKSLTPKKINGNISKRRLTVLYLRTFHQLVLWRLQLSHKRNTTSCKFVIDFFFILGIKYSFICDTRSTVDAEGRRKKKHHCEATTNV